MSGVSRANLISFSGYPIGFIQVPIMLKFILIALLFACAESSGSTSAPLDVEKVKGLYMEGDFDPAIQFLEDFQKTHRRFTREESLVVYKYLGVMYCADKSTREKGKSYFYKLLEVDHQAKILDLYVSIVVQEIFKSALDELMGQVGYGRNAPGDSLDGSKRITQSGNVPGPKQATSPKPELKPHESHAAYWWLGAAAIVVGAGGYYAYTQITEKTPEKSIEVTP